MSTSKNDLLVKNLIEFGFSDKEAKIYIALLALEIATANEIAKAANINRSSTYVVLNGLKNKGFVGLSNDKKVQGYVAVSPDVILETLESGIRKNKILREKIQEIVPDLKGLEKSNKNNPIIRVFNGDNEMRELHSDDFTVEFDEIRVYENPQGYLDFFPEYVKKDNDTRIKRGAKMYNISPASGESEYIAKIYQNLSPDNKDEYCFIPEKYFHYPVDVAIYGNKVAFSSIPSSKDKFGVLIEHKEISEALKCLFDLAWEEAKRIRVNKELVYRNPDNKISAKKSKGKK